MSSSGWIILDKPSGMTSRRAGGIVARMFGAKTFGHLGTLDPMASGVLPIALGEATKMIPFLEGQKDKGTDGQLRLSICPSVHLSIKEYEFSIQWGIRTDTDDITGTVLEQNDNIPTDSQIADALPKLVGEYDQMPPDYSAKKINGVPAYKLARAGVAPDLKPKRINIYSLEIMDNGQMDRRTNVQESDEMSICPSVHLSFRVRCSAGTYVRSISRDIARLIGADFLATTSMIRRTAANGFSIKNAVPLDFLENLYNNNPESAAEYLQPIDCGLDGIPVCKLETNSAELFQNGGFIDIPRESSGLVRVYNNDRVIGIGRIENGVLKPERVLVY